MFSELISCSIVVYKENPDVLKKAINSFLRIKFSKKLYIIDNSPTDDLKNDLVNLNVEYIFNPGNPGFGSAHNLILPLVNSKYHLVLNPDIYFEPIIIDNIIKFLDTNSDIGVLMPKVLYPSGELQYIAKLLPTPYDFIIRRFVPFNKLKIFLSKKFELRFTNYTKIMDVPFLSGCFLFFNSQLLKNIKGFDENIFMYTEDIDICRRVLNENRRCVFYPNVIVYHDTSKKSFFKFSNFLVYSKSAIYYFNKWGWFIDSQRKNINKMTLNQLK